MGHGLILQCGSCGAEEGYTLGIGMMYRSLEAVLDIVVPRGKRKKIRALLDHDSMVETKYEHQLYACPRCETLHGRFFILIRHRPHMEFLINQTEMSHYEFLEAMKFKTVYRSRFRCGPCRSGLVYAREGWNAYRCRSCGEKALVEMPGLCWD